MNCACGRPLHYSDLAYQLVIEDCVRRFGPDMITEVGSHKYQAQRHYLAIHGLEESEIEGLMAQGIVRKVA